MNTTKLLAPTLFVAVAGVASAQNDECTGATALMVGITPFDTTSATASPEVWPCAAGGGPDLWYTYTATSTDNIRIETCGSTYDTALEVFTGTCGALVPLACNDDDCGLQSGIDINGVTAGTVYTFRVGGFNGATGVGDITISTSTPPPPPAPNCVETLFDANNGGSAGGAVYFDLTVTQPVSFSGLLTNTSASGVPIGMTVWMTAGTYVGNEANPGAWMQVAEDDGTPVGLGQNAMTPVNFLAPFNLAPGTYGIALVGDNPTTGNLMDHDYTNGTGTNQNFMSTDGVLELNLGSATNVAFTGTPFSPRVWNGQICHGTGGGPGTNYCTANPNSTGVPAVMSASGSADVAMNNLVLESSDMPNDAFAFFLCSQTQGFVMNPSGSEGNLCLGGAIGRYFETGQIQNTGSTGSVSLAIDLAMTPTPTGFVSIQAGETWNFTCWFRDSNMGTAVSNLSDGLEITFN